MTAFYHAGDDKDHLKVILLRIDSSLQGVLSCLPDFIPSFRNGEVGSPAHSFFIAGASGPNVGSTKLREKAADIIHAACRYIMNLIFVFNMYWSNMPISTFLVWCAGICWKKKLMTVFY